MSISSFLLQVRGGNDRDPRGFYYDDDDTIKRAKSDRYSPREYDYREEKRNDDYYYQDGNYEEDRRYDRDYDDRGVKRTPSVRSCFAISFSFGSPTKSSDFIFAHLSCTRTIASTEWCAISD